MTVIHDVRPRPAPAAGGPPTTGARPARAEPPPGWTAIASELALTAVTVAAVVGLLRLFSDGSYLPAAVVAALASHGLAAGARRLRLSPFTAALLSAAGLAALVVWVVEPHTTTYGVPGAGTWDAIITDLRVSWDRFGEVVAPTPVTRGFVLASSMGAWLAAFLADLFAFRFRTRFEALVPSFTIFLFGAILGGDRHRLALSAGYLAALLLFVVFSDASGRSHAHAWFGGSSRLGDSILIRNGLVVAVAAVAAAAVLGPLLPNAKSPGLLGWRDRNRNSQSRLTVSPLVDIRARLVDQSNVEVFTVSADRPTYWRLTALDRFDGTIWSSVGSYRGTRGSSLPGDGATPAGSLLRQEYNIAALASVWIPAAYRPARLEGVAGVRFDQDSSSLLTDKPTSDGIQYTVSSSVPRLTAAELATVSGVVPDDVARRYLSVPPGLSPVVARLAREAAGSARTPYGRAKALQDWFRSSFTYSTEISPGHDEDAILRFLNTREGYCEQFAGTYAAMARTLGLPARVAVGFTPGRRDGNNMFHVAGKDAHAWPEVYLGDYGWVAFEPTPGRGLPGAEDYTQVEPPAAESEDTPAPTTTTPTTSPEATTPTTAAQSPAPAPAPTERTPRRSGPGPLAMTAIVLAVLGGAYLAGVPLAKRWRRARRRAAAETPSDRVLVAWSETEEELSGAGVGRQPAETVEEYTDRVQHSVPDPPAGLGDLAAGVSAAAYSAAGAGEDIARQAEQVAASVRDHLRATTPVLKRVMLTLDPRPLWPHAWHRGWRERETLN